MSYYYFLCWNVAVRSTDSDAVFDEKHDSLDRSTKRWRKRRSMYQATDSNDSMSEPEEAEEVCFIV